MYIYRCVYFESLKLMNQDLDVEICAVVGGCLINRMLSDLLLLSKLFLIINYMKLSFYDE